MYPYYQRTPWRRTTGVAGIITLVKEFRALDGVKLEGTLPFLKSPISLNLPSSVGVCNRANNNLVTSCQGTRLDSKRGGTYGKVRRYITPIHVFFFFWPDQTLIAGNIINVIIFLDEFGILG